VIQPGDDTYDAARHVYNAMIERHPGLIARCNDVADVVAALGFARAHDLTVAVRGGGHNGGGLGVCDDGMVIDLSPMRWVRVDPVERTVRVGGGSTWGDVDHATHPFGLAVPAGVVSTTGVGGLTLGGGIGHLTRRFGLTIDNLLSADVVLADGRIVTASADHHPDLFWAIRGGGGNFGIVTSFLFRGQPVRQVVAGPMLWRLEHAPTVMRWYRDFIRTAPEDLNGFFAFLGVPPGPPFPEALHEQTVCGIVWCYTGPVDRAEGLLAQARRAAPPVFELVGPMPFPALQGMFDPIFPPGLQWYWRADFVNELGDEAIARHVEHGSRLPSWRSTMHLYPVNGAAGRVPHGETPWAYRHATWAEVIVGVDPDPANAARITAWCKDYWDAVHPYSAGGAYVNFMMDEGRDRVRATYGPHYDRLARVKAQYDPENVFRVNQNIPPAA
jgi:FAD/FMN-containing dehydrogenase